MDTQTDRIDAIRSFSRFYTRHIGLLSEGILDSRFSLTEARAIYELAQSGAEGATGSTLADRLTLDPGYVSRMVGALEAEGIAEKTRSGKDRRQVIVRLTRKGQRAFETLEKRSRKQIADLLEETDDSSQEALVAAMSEIQRTLDTEGCEPPLVRYRAHRPGDMGWVVQRHAELYHASHGWDERFEAMVADICARLIERYDPTCERTWIAEVDGRRAGGIALVRRSKRVGQLRLLLVEPWARGLGIGTRLVSECVGQARHFGYHRMVLFTVAGLESARRLYEAEGFVLTDETPGHEWGKDHLAQTWELDL